MDTTTLLFQTSTSKTKTAVNQYAKAWDQTNIEGFLKIRKAMNLKGSNKHTSGNIVMDKDNKPWIKTVPIVFNVNDAKDDGEASYESISCSVINNMFHDKPELIEGNPDKNHILEMLDDQNCSCIKRLIDQESYKGRGVGGIKASLENAIKDSKRETCWFSNSVTEFHTADVKSFQIIGSNKTTYNPEAKVFLLGFIPYDKSIHGPMNTSLPSVLPKANYAISSVETEDGETIEDINGGQVIPFPFATSKKPKLFVYELEKAILRSKVGHVTHIAGVCKSIMSMTGKPSSAPKGIALSDDVYNPNLIDRIVKSIELRGNVKLTLKKSRGRQPPGYIRYSSISWKFNV